MRYDAELQFFIKFLDNLRLNHTLLTPNIEPDISIDFGLRDSIGLNSEYERLIDFATNKIQPNTVYFFADNFFCKYLLLQLPEIEPAPSLLIGPYTEHHCTEQTIYEAFEKLDVSLKTMKQVFQFFARVPYIPDSGILTSLINTLASTLWGSEENYSFINGFHTLSDDALQHMGDSLKASDNVDYQMQLLENRYAAENRFLRNIAQGHLHKVEAAFSSSTLMDIEPRIPNSLRNFKNYCIIMNTLFRKAVEQGSVHPFHIDQLSSAFAQKIEQIHSLPAGKQLMKEMVHKYCLLVKNHSMKGYSLPVQKVITHIDADLTADLSLRAQAETLNVNPSYLSTLFKKETGQTLTDYVNERRVQHGIFLLNSTTLQIQTIAQYCGISDINYFTRIFKKHTGHTPSEYRSKIHV